MLLLIYIVVNAFLFWHTSSVYIRIDKINFPGGKPCLQVTSYVILVLRWWRHTFRVALRNSTMSTENYMYYLFTLYSRIYYNVTLSKQKAQRKKAKESTHIKNVLMNSFLFRICFLLPGIDINKNINNKRKKRGWSHEGLFLSLELAPPN